MTSQSNPPPPAEPRTRGNPPRNADAWARPVAALTVNEAPVDGINLNVEGRQAMSPLQGFGWMWRKRHSIRLDRADVTPVQVIETWKRHFGDFWPRGNFFFGPITGLRPGEVAVINLAMPARTKLSTGVLVLYADDESFTLMTPQGHVFAGWITFSAHEEDGITVAQAEILMRASDPFMEAGMMALGHRRENRFWEQTLENVAARFGVQAEARTEVECLDRHYQWGQARNIWHNAQIRTALYLATRPIRSLGSRIRSR